MTELTGKSILGFRRGSDRGPSFQGLNPATGERLAPEYFTAGAVEVDEAARLSVEAFATFSRASSQERAKFLRKIAENLESIVGELAERAHQETALPVARIQSETARACFQLRMFADLVEEGSWVDARLDRADPARQPVPKPDVRSLLRPLGPVAVFGASNFPVAFSVGGGDTASAFAAACPVIVKAHPAHPGTSELAGIAILNAVRECGLADGVFSLLFDAGFEVGAALVRHPGIKAVGFTGSRAGGLGLMAQAAARAGPIPFYAEMSSVNPVFILPGALKERGDQIASGLFASVTQGAGQFCTNPGLVILDESHEAALFAAKLAASMAASSEFTMLTPGIGGAFRSAIAKRAQLGDIKTVVSQRTAEGPGRSACGAALFSTSADSFLKHPEFSEEVFGPTTLLVTSSRREEMMEMARRLDGHLTATIHGTADDLRECAELLAILETKVGRLLINGFPTGVEVCHAMTHGGPFPATSDSRVTSVGSRAILRFARPVCYQNFPDHLLPTELKNENPLGIWRMVDGKMTKDRVE